MARTIRFSQVLWSVTLVWLTACGRVGFDPFASEDTTPPPDGSAPDATPVGPVMAIAVPTMTTECGNSPDAYQLSITNSGDQDLVISNITPKQNVMVGLQAPVTNAVAVPVATIFTVQITALPLTIAPGTSAQLTVIPPAAVVGTDVGATMKSGSFTIEAKTAPAQDVALAATVVGANVAITNPAGTANINMMTSGTCPSRPVTITYSGNAPAQIDVSASSGLGLSGFTSGMVGAATTEITTVRAVSNQCAASGLTMQYQVTGVVCQKPAILNVTYQITGASGGCSCS